MLLTKVGDKGGRGFCWLKPLSRWDAAGEISSALLRDDSGKRWTGRFAASTRRFSLSPLSLRLRVEVVETLRLLDRGRVESTDRSLRARLSEAAYSCPPRWFLRFLARWDHLSRLRLRGLCVLVRRRPGERDREREREYAERDVAERERERDRDGLRVRYRDRVGDLDLDLVGDREGERAGERERSVLREGEGE